MTKAPNGEDTSLSPVDVRLRAAGVPPADQHETIERWQNGERGHVQPPRWPAAAPDPRDARRRGLHRLRLATASLGVASVVGTGVLMPALADHTPAADESGGDATDDGSAAVPSTGAPSPDDDVTAPVAPPGPAAPGPVDASSGAS